MASNAFVAACARMRAHLNQDHRYAHTVRVARMADLLAQAHGADPAKARLAGLLHDLARLYPAPRLLLECEARGIPIDAFAEANPVVLHAPLGAELAREMFAVDDPEILGAIAKHTLAAERMSPLECIVYLADGLEPGRGFPERAALAELAMRDLGAAMAATIEATIGYLEKQGRTVAPQTATALKYFRRPQLAELIDVVREAALDKKGEDFIVLSLEGRTILADAFAIVTGRSKIQTRAIADAIVEAAKAAKFHVARVEGYAEGSWILLDLGTVVAHIFTPEQRDFYNLERLWSDAPLRVTAQS